MQFFAITVKKQKTGKDNDEAILNPPVKVRYKVSELSHYQEFDSGAIVWLNGGVKLWTVESVEQLDMILNGANDKTVGLLYGTDQ